MDRDDKLKINYISWPKCKPATPYHKSTQFIQLQLVSVLAMVTLEFSRTLKNVQRWSTGVTHHWTRLLDWHTGMEYWTNIFFCSYTLDLFFS